MGDRGLGRIRIVHPYSWLWEPLESEPSFLLRSMFGAKAVYLDGRMVLCFSSGAEPWNGMLVCTERSHHESLVADFPALSPHPILPKWLYLSDSADGFDRWAEALVSLAKKRDPRVGIIPKIRARKRAKRA